MCESVKSIFITVVVGLSISKTHMAMDPCSKSRFITRLIKIWDYIQVKLNYEACMSPIIMCHAICPGHIPIAENLLENQFHRLFKNQVNWPQHVRTILNQHLFYNRVAPYSWARKSTGWFEKLKLRTVWGVRQNYINIWNLELKAKMNQEKEQTEEEQSICEFCQIEVYEIEHDCLVKVFDQDMFWTKWTIL